MTAAEPYHIKNTDEVLNQFNVSSNAGLSLEEADRRIVEFGPNELPPVRRSIWKLYFAPFLENTIIIVYLIAATVMVILNLLIQDTSFSPYLNFFIVIFNALVAIIQQLRAQISLNALKRMSKNEVTVIRNGMKISIDSSRVVPGDILDLQEGDKITTDARLIVANNFFVNESALTGESVPVNKKVAPLPGGKVKGLQDMKNCIFSGTFVTKGTARAVVFSTAGNTEIGRISKNLTQASQQEIPLKAKINQFANALAIIVAVMFVVSWIYTIIFNVMAGTFEQNFIRDLVSSIELALKFIPINIVLLATIILITGVLAMAKKGVITRNLTAVEAMGRASVVCTDKTGTLTQNAMTVQKVWANGRLFDVSGTGYTNQGVISLDGTPVDKETYKSLKKLVIAGLLNGNAHITEEKVKVKGEDKPKTIRKVIGDPMEGALNVLAEKLKIYEGTMLKHLSFVQEYPFDSELKRMSKIWASTSPAIKHEWIAFVKGATEQIIDRCTSITGDGEEVEPLDDGRKASIKAAVSGWASKGYRTLGIAWKGLKALPPGKEYERDEVETDISLLGFVVIQDPPRPGVREAVETCEQAGVTVVMITGDAPDTGAAIGRELSILTQGEEVVEGRDLAGMNDERFFKTAVWARVSPDDKQVIVKRYQDNKRVVAMTGDGVNDALALAMSDVGLAMGMTGTDVAKEAADMIISDDSFTTIELGIREGRGLFAKIRTMIYFYVYANLAEAIILFLTSFANKDFRLFDIGWQIQAIYFLAHSLPPLGLTFDRTSMDIMKEKPRDEEEIFSKHVLRMMLIHIIYLAASLLVMALLVIAAFFADPALVTAVNTGTPAEAEVAMASLNAAMARPRAMAIAVIFIIETSTVFSIRRPNIPVWRSFRKDMSPFLLFLCALCIVGLVAIINIPGLNDFFMFVPLDGADWAAVLGLTLPCVAVLELYKWYVRDVKKEHF